MQKSFYKWSKYNFTGFEIIKSVFFLNWILSFVLKKKKNDQIAKCKQ